MLYCIVSATSIQNSGYYRLKTNYRVYHCCLKFNFYWVLTAPAWAQAFQRGRRDRLFDITNHDGDSLVTFGVDQ